MCITVVQLFTTRIWVADTGNIMFRSKGSKAIGRLPVVSTTRHRIHPTQRQQQRQNRLISSIYLQLRSFHVPPSRTSGSILSRYWAFSPSPTKSAFSHRPNSVPIIKHFNASLVTSQRFAFTSHTTTGTGSSHQPQMAYVMDTCEQLYNSIIDLNNGVRYLLFANVVSCSTKISEYLYLSHLVSTHLQLPLQLPLLLIPITKLLRYKQRTMYRRI